MHETSHYTVQLLAFLNVHQQNRTVHRFYSDFTAKCSVDKVLTRRQVP